MSPERRYRLPAADTMLNRLSGVVNVPFAVEYVYPIILEAADCNLTAHEVVLKIALAIEEIPGSLPASAKQLLRLRLRDFANVLIDSKAGRAEAMMAINGYNASQGGSL